MSSIPLRHGPDARDVQGNVLAAFNKPRTTFLFISLSPDVDAARAWLAEMAPLVATTEEVEDFYENRRNKDGDGHAACWTGLGLTWEGLKALAPPCDLSSDLADHWAFRVGAAARAKDLDDQPQRWTFGHAGVIHAVVTIAADADADLHHRRSLVLDIGDRHGAKLECEQPCAVLPGPMRGREHFGFKDGLSQPGVRDFHAPDPEHPREREGHRGQLLMEPGEFVLGWPREGDDAEPVADWLRNASFQVVRRLDQDVAGWNKAVENAVGTDPAAAERWANRLIGRTRDGVPLATQGSADDNAFDYVDDADGTFTPRFAHIRKAFPRGEDRFEPQRHRLMRRGIPFGPPYGNSEDGAERGMLFNAFMASIERQFEHVQRLFANKPDFPHDGDGPDAVIGGRDPVADKAGRYRQEQINPREGSSKPVALEWFVETRGAVYALAPSKTALAWLATGGSGRASGA